MLKASLEHITYLSDTAGVPSKEAESLATLWVQDETREPDTSESSKGVQFVPWRQMPMGVRSYIHTFRQLLNYPSAALEILTGVSIDQWQEWEEGRWEDLPAKALFILIADLGASFDHILKLIETNASVEEGQQLAERWFMQRQQESVVTMSDDQDTTLLKHARWLNPEQKQRVLEYTNWVRSEIQELQLNLVEIAPNDQSRAQFVIINELSQQLTAALKKAPWLMADRWLWHVASLISAEDRHRRGALETEPERVHRALEEVLVENRGQQPSNT